MWRLKKSKDPIVIGDYGRTIRNKILPRAIPISFLAQIMYAPMLFFIALNIALDLTLYFLIRQLVNFWEFVFVWRGTRSALRRQMREASTYDEWRDAAQNLDKFLENDVWKAQSQSAFFDWELVNEFVERTSAALEADRPELVVKLLLHGGLKPNYGGVENEHVYAQCYYGTKTLIDAYVDVLCKALVYLQDHKSVTLEEKQRIFKAASRQYGRTALCLSGGASFGYFHLGVIKVLIEHDALPTVITGTSAGSLMASLLGCWLPEELERVLDASFYKHLTACADSWTTRLKRWYKTGAMFSQEDWFEKALFFTKGPLTFKEAFHRTGRILNISVVPDHPGAPAKLLNYLTAPDVVIASAILASSAVPHFLPPVELVMKQPDGQLAPYMASGKRWRDGSLRTDIPTMTLDSLYNVKFSIVSQVNPHVVLFFFDNRGSSGHPVAHRRGRGWRGGFFLASMERLLKLDLQKLLKLLKDLEMLPSVLSLVFLQRFHGSVTILPRVRLVHFFKFLEDPKTAKVMQEYMTIGEKRTWPKLYMIKNRLRVEEALARGRKTTRSQLQGTLEDGKGSAKSPVSTALRELEHPSLQNSDSDLTELVTNEASMDNYSDTESLMEPQDDLPRQTFFSRPSLFSAGEEFNAVVHNERYTSNTSGGIESHISELEQA